MTQIPYKAAVLGFTLVFSSLSQAMIYSYNIDSENDLREEFSQQASQFNEGIKNLQSMSDDLSDQEIRSRFEEKASKLFDFRRMAARIMGQYGVDTPKEKRDLFLEHSKDKFFESYFDDLLAAEGSEISVTNISYNNNEERATARTLISDSSGNSYNVSFSLFNNKNEVWKIENIIIEGLNIGLNLRDSFRQKVSEADGDIEKAIKEWNAIEDF